MKNTRIQDALFSGKKKQKNKMQDALVARQI